MMILEKCYQKIRDLIDNEINNGPKDHMIKNFIRESCRKINF